MNTNEIGAKAEIAMMGRHVPVEANEVQGVIQYILDTMHKSTTAEEVIKDALKYAKDKTIVYIGTSRLMGIYNVINLVLKAKTKNAKNPDMTEKNRNGVLAYCYNMDAPDCSELGYMFFKETPAGFVRIS